MHLKACRKIIDLKSAPLPPIYIHVYIYILVSLNFCRITYSVHSSPKDLDEDITGNRQCLLLYLSGSYLLLIEANPKRPFSPSFLFPFSSFTMAYKNAYRYVPVT